MLSRFILIMNTHCFTKFLTSFFQLVSLSLLPSLFSLSPHDLACQPTVTSYFLIVCFLSSLSEFYCREGAVSPLAVGRLLSSELRGPWLQVVPAAPIPAKLQPHDERGVLCSSEIKHQGQSLVTKAQILRSPDAGFPGQAIANFAVKSHLVLFLQVATFLLPSFMLIVFRTIFVAISFCCRGGWGGCCLWR